MTLTTRIHCLADAEPATFHQKDGAPPTTAYALNLNVECQTDQPFDDTAMAKARIAFKLFLEKVGMAEFHLFLATFGTLPSGDTGVTALDHLYRIGGGAGQGDVLSEPTPLSDTLLLQWLEEASDTLYEDAYRNSTKPTDAEKKADAGAAVMRYWLVASGTTADAEIVVDQAEIGATHDLRSAHTSNPFQKKMKRRLPLRSNMTSAADSPRRPFAALPACCRRLLTSPASSRPMVF